MYFSSDAHHHHHHQHSPPLISVSPQVGGWCLHTIGWLTAAWIICWLKQFYGITLQSGGAASLQHIPAQQPRCRLHETARRTAPVSLQLYAGKLLKRYFNKAYFSISLMCFNCNIGNLQQKSIYLSIYLCLENLAQNSFPSREENCLI